MKIGKVAGTRRVPWPELNQCLRVNGAVADDTLSVPAPSFLGPTRSRAETVVCSVRRAPRTNPFPCRLELHFA